MEPLTPSARPSSSPTDAISSRPGSNMRRGLSSPHPLPQGVGAVLRIESKEAAAAVITRLRLHLKPPTEVEAGASSSRPSSGYRHHDDSARGARAAAGPLDPAQWKAIQEEALSGLREVHPDRQGPGQATNVPRDASWCWENVSAFFFSPTLPRVCRCASS